MRRFSVVCLTAVITSICLSGIFASSTGGASARPAEPLILVRWSGAPTKAPDGWIPLESIEGGEIGLLPAGAAEPDSPELTRLGVHDDGARLYFISPSTFARLQRGEIPPAWQSVLPASGPGAPSRADLAQIRELARDRSRVLIRLPESMRAVAQAPGGRCRPLTSPARAAARAAIAAARADDGGSAGFDPSNPARLEEIREQLPEYWQALTRAVNTDHFDADLDYLSTTLRTRYAYAPQMDQACQYVYDEFAALGLQTSFDSFTWNGHALKNVLGVKLGTVDPSRIYVILGHLDSISPSPLTLAPGADDNGSGAVAVLESARLFAGIPTDYTIYFLCVTAEEQGLIGSEHFAALADQQNLDIRGVLTFDMIGWYDPAGADLWIEGFRQGVSSLWLMTMLRQNAEAYAGLTTYLYPGEGWGSDHEPFHDHGFPAILSIENEWDDYPCYHQTCDTVDQLTASFWQKITAANVVTLGQLAQAQGALGAIDGLITVAGGGHPEGATIRLSGTTYTSATSDPAGEFTFPSLFPGLYTLVAELPGYSPVTSELAVPSGGVAEVELHFDQPLPASVHGIVRGRNGLPLSGARIEVEGQPTWALSGFDGSFSLTPVTPGSINLSASYAGMLPRGMAVQLTPGQDLTGIDLMLASSWDFEESDEGLRPSAGWEWGVDATAGAHSGQRVWGTILGAIYEGCADYRLDFPPVSLRSYAFARLRLWGWTATQAGADGGNLQASTDGGVTWQVIDPLPGYDGSLSGACNPLAGTAGLSGVSETWVERTWPLDAYLGRWVRLRFHFGADDLVEDRGWYLDDLALQSAPDASSADDGSDGDDETVLPGVNRHPGITLSILPNPSTHGAVIAATLESFMSGNLAIYAADGHQVATLCAGGGLDAGRHDFTWDGTDASGRAVAAGTYWARFEAGGTAVTRSLIVVR